MGVLAIALSGIGKALGVRGAASGHQPGPATVTREAPDTAEALLARVAGGDREAFRSLYESSHRQAYVYLMRHLRDKTRADDLLVDTYTEVWRCAKNFRGRSRATTWIIGIARNLMRNELKSERAHENIEDHERTMSSPHNPMLEAESRNRTEILRAAMERLSDAHRETLDLVFFLGLTYAEVSEVMSVPENTVKTRVFFAKDALRKALQTMRVTRHDL